jgi:hypothetical protein
MARAMLLRLVHTSTISTDGLSGAAWSGSVMIELNVLMAGIDVSGQAGE